MNIMTHFSRLTLTLHHLCRVPCQGKTAPAAKKKPLQSAMTATAFSDQAFKYVLKQFGGISG